MNRRHALQMLTSAAATTYALADVRAWAAATSSVSSADALPRLRVHDSGHYLQREDGRPFFWLGDTAWLIMHRAAPHEVSYYLQTRARQGFTVVQVSLLSELDGLRTPSFAGELPLENADPARPREPYFQRVADFFAEAADHGLYVAVIAAWGDKVTAPWGDGPRIFSIDKLPVARRYGQFLGERFANHTNVVWLMGGDRPPRLTGDAQDWMTKTGIAAGFAPNHDWIPLWRAMAEGLREASGSQALVSYHPAGGSRTTSHDLQDESWLDVHGMQSGHGGGHDVPVWEWIERDFALNPPRPTLDLEPNYEDHPFNPWPKWDPASGYFRDHDVRKQCYRSVFAGGCGVTYGHHSVWQWYCSRYPAVNFPDREWVDALHRPAASQMLHLRRLVESRPFWTRVPDQTLITGGDGVAGNHLRALRDGNGAYAMIYFPHADLRARIDLNAFAGKKVRGWWYDPRNGFARSIDGIAPHGVQEFASPPFGPDWVLVLDDAAAKFAAPGLIS